MTKKTTCIVAYLTIIGWLVAYLAGDKEGSKVHLNQGLVLGLALVISGFLGFIPFFVFRILRWLLWIAAFAFEIVGIIYAATDNDNELPLIGMIKILK